MNNFLILAELIHFMSFLLLYLKIRNTKNCSGISYRTQEIYLLVFFTRFCDLNTYYETLDYVLRIFYLLSTGFLIYLIKFQKPVCLTYQGEQDNFPHYKVLYPIAILLTLFIHTGNDLYNWSQSLSIWLEAFAIIPQMNLIRKNQDIENMTGKYVFCLGIYRLLYIISWYCRVVHLGWWCWTQILGGTTAAIIYSDFLYLYLRNKGQLKVEV